MIDDILPRLPRVEALIGARLRDVDAGILQGLVSGRVAEDSDLDFKQEVYTDSEKQHREAAADIAAMANAQGGVIFLGIREKNLIAVEVTPPTFSEAAEMRIRQTVIARCAPAPLFMFHRVPTDASGEVGVYMIVIQPSPNAPHAVRDGERLGYPRRDGPRRRWLSESEVAEAYRSRFAAGRRRAELLAAIQAEPTRHLSQHHVWATIALVPTVMGSFEIRRRSQNLLLEDAARRWFSQEWGRGVFSDYPHADTGVGKVVLAAGRGQEGFLSRSGYAELHTNGCAFAAIAIAEVDPARPPEKLTHTADVDDERLVEGVVAAVELTVDFATRYAGCSGDAEVSIGIEVGMANKVILSFTRQGGRMALEGSRAFMRGGSARHSLSLDDALSGPGRLVAARMLLTDAFQSFGYPEVLQITSDGQLRSRYIADHNKQRARLWADANAVTLVETRIEQE